ncbi:MAG: alpha/beta hydrolase family esterase [Candidatus Dormibacteria bacterium]
MTATTRRRPLLIASGALAVIAVTVAGVMAWRAPGSRPGAHHPVATVGTHVEAAAIADVPSQDHAIRWSSETMAAGGLQRAWWLARPDKPLRAELPLALVLHGRGATPLDEAQRTGLLPQVAAGRLIAAYPEGYAASWDAGTCCGDAYTAHVDDVTFLSALLHRLQALPDVLPDEVAVIGFSNGGKMALRLACSGVLKQSNPPVRAMAIVAAAAVSPCEAGPHLPVVQVAGTVDPIVPYDRPAATPSPDIPPVPVVNEFAAWRQLAGCGVDSSATAATPLQVTEWWCSGGPLELATDLGGGHGWPTGATDTIWTFLTPLLEPPSNAGRPGG